MKIRDKVVSLGQPRAKDGIFNIVIDKFNGLDNEDPWETLKP